MESENGGSTCKISERKKSKPIMVTGITNNIAVELSSGDKFGFEVKITGNCLKISLLTSVKKISIIECLWQQKVQHYVVPDREISIKVVIRGLPLSTNLELIKETLNCKRFSIIKISQFKRRRSGKLSPLFLAELPKYETSFVI